MHKVTLIIPTFNRVTMLLNTLKVLNERSILQNVHLIILDNASEDTTIKSVNQFLTPLAISFEVVESNLNLGMIGNFNRIAQIVKTEFFMFCSDDDYYTEKLNSYLVNIDKTMNGCDVAVFDTSIIIQGENMRQRNLSGQQSTNSKVNCFNVTSFFKMQYFILTSAIYRNDTKKHLKFSETHGPLADLVVILKILLNCRVRIINQVILEFNRHSQQAGGTASFHNSISVVEEIYNTGRHDDRVNKLDLLWFVVKKGSAPRQNINQLLCALRRTNLPFSLRLAIRHFALLRKLIRVFS